MKIRPPRDSDQNNVNKLLRLIKDIDDAHPEFDGTIRASAAWAGIIKGYKLSKVTYEEFCQEVEEVKKHYKSICTSGSSNE